MRGFTGSFTLHVPCVLWTTDENGDRVYDREVVATWGPLPIPAPGSIAVGRGGLVSFEMGKVR
ncbi:hypothetical protein GCM10011390_03230 [Aureimonas endophytica]|uniref:Uncharacterized protein n=1 Tax=Aureimonas endophytica TaxID=2027858 RepID=A0A916ZCC2_9HYPH|nr:hypothetical protein GCM10011390_03230 [Aureimonas endophytica]